MDYFSERTNPFYNRQCNNEHIKMQRLSRDHLLSMIGLEYELIHVQEPILYIIRSQHRHSPVAVQPLTDYYIIAGIVYQAPDLSTIINSRLLTAIHGLESAFDEAQSYSRYHPSKGYWWEFKDQAHTEKLQRKEKRKKDEPSSVFQRQRVDLLLADLAQKFPPKMLSVPTQDKKIVTDEPVKMDVKQEVKAEKVSVDHRNKPPQDKKPKLMRN